MAAASDGIWLWVHPVALLRFPLAPVSPHSSAQLRAEAEDMAAVAACRGETGPAPFWVALLSQQG